MALGVAEVGVVEHGRDGAVGAAQAHAAARARRHARDRERELAAAVAHDAADRVDVEVERPRPRTAPSAASRSRPRSGANAPLAAYSSQRRGGARACRRTASSNGRMVVQVRPDARQIDDRRRCRARAGRRPGRCPSAAGARGSRRRRRRTTVRRGLDRHVLAGAPHDRAAHPAALDEQPLDRRIAADAQRRRGRAPGRGRRSAAFQRTPSAMLAGEGATPTVGVEVVEVVARAGRRSPTSEAERARGGTAPARPPRGCARACRSFAACAGAARPRRATSPSRPLAASRRSRARLPQIAAQPLWLEQPPIMPARWNSMRRPR